jgi:hypothetical protein
MLTTLFFVQADWSLEDRLADIAEESEAGEEDQTTKPISKHVKVTRGHPRSRVLQVRLNPDEYAAIERITERRRLPASTVAREELLRLLPRKAQKTNLSWHWSPWQTRSRQ